MIRPTAAIVMTLALTITGGCAVAPETSSYLAAESVMADQSMARAAPATVSLFPEDQAIMGDETLAAILDGELQLPERVWLAVVPVGQTPDFAGYAPDFADKSREIETAFFDSLRSGERVEYAQTLPSMLRPRGTSVPELRLAAARYRSDLMLVVHTTTRTYENDRLLGRDRVRAFCNVEAVLVDVRSGTVPFSTDAVEDFLAVKEGDDLRFRDTIARANQEAVGRAWLRVAGETAAFLSNGDAATAR